MPTRPTRRRNVDTRLIQLAAALFTRLNWPVNDSEDGGEELFNRFCELLSLLRDEERDLILTLTGDFLRCPVGRYRTLARQAAAHLPLATVEWASKIIILPLTRVRPESLRFAWSRVEWSSVGWLLL